MPAYSNSTYRFQDALDRVSNASNSPDVQTLHEENKQLKELVIRLSNIVIKHVVEAK
jgi:hypothetical protein